jgi:hypothetical protein
MNPSNYMDYRDLQYEEENVGYDCEYPEGGIKCKNYELCESLLPKWWFECKANYLCPYCDMHRFFGWKELVFRDSDEECIVCNETGSKQVKFPAECGHWFCTTCTRNIIFIDETRYHLSPVPFGCPPCPNGCVNPIKGKQCYCENYDEILEKWREENPIAREEYNDAETLSIELGETTAGSVFGSKKCPLCRKLYEKVK